MGKPLRVLMVEDNADDAELLVRQLTKGGFEPEWMRVETAAEMEKALDEGEWDVIMADYKLPKFSAPKALDLLRRKAPGLPFIIVSGTVEEEIIVESMKAGAVDFFRKDKLKLLPLAIERELRERREKRRSEDALKASEERYRTLYESSRDAIMTLAPPSWSFTAGNPATVELFRAKDDAEFVSKGPWELSPEHQPDGRSSSIKAKEMIDIAMEKGSNFFEWTHRRLDGTDFPATVLLSRFELGGATVVQATVRDISAQKKMEDRLKKINECLLDLSSDYGKNINLLTALVGELFFADCALYNYFRGEIIYTLAKWHAPEDMKTTDRAEGHICYDVVHANGHEVMLVKDLQESGYAKSDPNVAAYGLKTYIGKAVRAHGANVGSLCAVFTKDVEFSEDDKRILSIIATAIGGEEERKTAQEEISRSEEKYRVMVENVHDVIYSCDQDGVITYISPNVAEFGYAQDDIIGHNLAEFIHPDDFAAVKSDLEIALTSGKEYPTECRIRKKDGEYIFAEEMDRMAGDGATDKKILGVIRDITERKRTELDLKKSREEISEWSRVLEDRVAERTEALEKAQKRIVEQEKLAVVGQIAASISHELRTPLTGIKNSTYFLKMLGLEKTSPKVAENISLIDMEVDACVRVLNNMLDFVRPKMPIRKPSRIDMIVKTTLSNMVMPTNIKVSVDLPEEAPSIMLDAFQIQQVFENVIRNALDAMGMGGELNIKVFVEGKDMVVEFADTGIGISPVNINKIFDPLYSTTPTGTGLGLTVTRQLVEAHGGTIKAESEPGKGSVFTIRLPLE